MDRKIIEILLLEIKIIKYYSQKVIMEDFQTVVGNQKNIITQNGQI